MEGPKMEETFWPNGNIKSRWYNNDNNQLNNKEGAAYQHWYEKGQLWRQEYFINGRRHNEQGPALERWFENGQLGWQEYYINGQRHNEQGPAFKHWDKNGQLWMQEYWIEGKELTETEFKSMIPSVKSASKS